MGDARRSFGPRASSASSSGSISRPSSSIGTYASSAPVRSHSICHGTMLEWCSISVTTTRSPAPTLAEPHEYATRLIASVALRVKTVSPGAEPANAATFSRAPS